MSGEQAAHEATEVARRLLRRLQAAIDARDLNSLGGLFDDDALLVGTTAHSKGRREVDEYLSAVLGAPEPLRWEWRDIVIFHEAPGTLGFAGFGEVTVSGPDGNAHAPFRLTALAVERSGAWRFQQFHGSIPSDF
jgi:hypothetical protein